MGKEERRDTLIVVGDRRYSNYLEMWNTLDALVKNLTPKLEVYTGANYTDQQGEHWPKENGRRVGADFGAYEWGLKRRHRVWIFHADWSTNGKQASPVRNSEMIDQAPEDAFMVAFDGGGPGTADVLRKARAKLRSKRIRVVKVEV